MTYVLKFDGGCNPNPGEMGIGVIVLDDSNKKVLELSRKIGFGTNNQAEYRAVITGMEELRGIYTGELLIQGDSKLVINQLTGKWQVKGKELQALFYRIKELENEFQAVNYNWVNREENAEADLLSAKALGLNVKKRKEVRIELRPGSYYEFIFDDDSKIEFKNDNRFDRTVTRYYVIAARKDGKKINGTYFETGSKKLNQKLEYYKPLGGKVFKIIPTKAQNWIEFMVEEIDTW